MSHRVKRLYMMKQLIQDLEERKISARVSFDLSHIGLSVNEEVAFKQLVSLAKSAQPAGIELFISMEETAKTEAILAVYKQAVAISPNIGITLQAQLHQTAHHLSILQDNSSRIRLVKGAYQEPEQLALPRSEALNKRYLELLERLIEKDHRVSIATHDECIIDEVIKRGWAQKPS